MAPSLLHPSEGTVAEDWLSTPSWIEGASGAFDLRGRQPGRQGAFDTEGGGHVPMSPPKYAPARVDEHPPKYAPGRVDELEYAEIVSVE